MIDNIVDVLAVIGTIFVITTTLGLSIEQMNTGLKELLKINTSTTLQIRVIVGIQLIVTMSVQSGLNKGVKLLSVGNFYLSIIALEFLLIFRDGG